MQQKAIERKGKNKLEDNILKKITLDLNKLLNMLQPDENLRPSLTAVNFIGLAAMRLEDIARPAKIMAQFNKEHQKVFKLLKEYIVNKYDTLVGGNFYNYEDIMNRSIEFQSNKSMDRSLDRSVEANESHDSSLSETSVQFQTRMTQPWVEGSEFAFYGLLKRDSYTAIVLRKIKPVQNKDKNEKVESKPVLDIEIVIDHRYKNHPVRFAELINAYFDTNVEYRRLTFYWLQMLKLKGVVGAKKGYLSEEAYIIIMITWLQKNFHLTKAQIGLDKAAKLSKEKMPNDQDVNLGYAFSLRGQLGQEEMKHVEATGQGRVMSRTPYLKVDYSFIKDPAILRQKADKFSKFVKGRSPKGKHLSVILMKLARKLIIELPRKNLVFNPKQGKIYSKRSRSSLLISIKDPFVKEINYGWQMRDREKLKNLVDVLKSFLKAAADKNSDDWFMEVGDAQLYSVSAATSPNQDSLTNSASPASSSGPVDHREEEEKKDNNGQEESKVGGSSGLLQLNEGSDDTQLRHQQTKE